MSNRSHHPLCSSTAWPCRNKCDRWPPNPLQDDGDDDLRESAMAVARRLIRNGLVEMHGHFEHSGGCASCRELKALFAALGGMDEIAPVCGPNRRDE